ncbi:polysaccharide deacetylase family protein [Phycisphaerales bacterium AB-hyl4]|uniref:Polysaccharide deacetylase family protein n=1 Tax=Natronomicrosphaera hydrolytica TaxID=3242702 RepID=A0ABV4U249_9BACT
MSDVLPWAMAGVGAAAFGALMYGAFYPSSRLIVPVIYRGPRDGPPRVALTFDDGPHAEATPAILDALDRVNAKAAFFVIGAHAKRHVDVLRRIDAAGHLIGNHTYDHAYHGMCRGYYYWLDQLRRTERVIEDAIGKRPTLFRPPMGFKQLFISCAVQSAGYSMVTWSRRGRDGWPCKTQQILDRLVGPSRNGDILTLHDGTDGHNRSRDIRPTVDAIEPLVVGLRGQGLELERLDRLINLPGYVSESALAN